ncbi:MAG TPA: hypothetical protein VL068_14820 [Microthrixaceae bacterium]|nr:hypothetical protein [Microthrixaceae bacterium]
MIITDLSSDTADPGLLEAVFERVLRPSFSTDELPDFAYLLNGFNVGQVVSVATMEGQVIGAGVASSQANSQASSPTEGAGDGAANSQADGAANRAAGVTGKRGEDISLLHYLAISPDARSGGIGGAILDHMLKRWRRLGTGLALAEIHDPRFHAETTDEKPLARARFYAKHGGELLDVAWVQPALADGSDPVDGMLLVALHRSGMFAGERLPSAPILAMADGYFGTASDSSDAFPASEPNSVPAALRERLDQPDGIRVLRLLDFDKVEPLTD